METICVLNKTSKHDQIFVWWCLDMRDVALRQQTFNWLMFFPEDPSDEKSDGFADCLLINWRKKFAREFSTHSRVLNPANNQKNDQIFLQTDQQQKSYWANMIRKKSDHVSSLLLSTPIARCVVQARKDMGRVLPVDYFMYKSGVPFRDVHKT